MAHSLKVLADLFAFRGHALKKWLFFRFAEGVRPYKPPFALRHSSGTASGSGKFVKAADPEKQTLLRLDPLIQHRNEAFAITLSTYYGRPWLSRERKEGFCQFLDRRASLRAARDDSVLLFNCRSNKLTGYLTILVFATLVTGWQPIHAETSGVEYLMSEEQEAEVYSEDLEEAWQHFRRDDPASALKIFRLVARASDAKATDRLQALFRMGLSYEFMPPEPQVQDAKRTFQAIIDEYPDNSLVPWALLEMGKLTFRKTANLDYWNNAIDNEEARIYFRRILTDYPDSVAIHEAAVRLANTYFFEVDRPESDQALEILKDHLEAHPNNPLAAGMHLLLTIWYSNIRQDYRAAAPHAIKLGELQQSNPYRWSEVYWRVATIFHKGLGDLEEATHWYRKLIEVTPDARQALQAQKELEKIEQKISAGGRPQ